MIKYFCDRCGKEIDSIERANSKHKGPGNFFGLGDSSGIVFNNTPVQELCNKCQDEFERFMENKRKAK